MLRCAAGRIYRPGEGFAHGWVLHDEARVLDAGEGQPPQKPDAHGVILAALVNAHTHVGDFVGRGANIAGLSLADVVAPPDGLKHRILRATAQAELTDGMRAALQEMAAAGVRAFVDFREQGVDGVGDLRLASQGAGPAPVVFGRCAGAFDEEEAAAVLAVSDGYGLSALADANEDAPERAAALSRRMRKRFALHLSEGAREDAARALALRPDFLVHCVAATREDLRAISDADVPIVVCPRSNAIFGALPDVPGMLAEGITLAIGSDNAMFHDLDPLADARLLRARFPDVAPEVWLDALIEGGARVAEGQAPRSWLRKGDAPAMRVLTATRDPWDAVFPPAQR